MRRILSFWTGTLFFVLLSGVLYSQTLFEHAGLGVRFGFPSGWEVLSVSSNALQVGDASLVSVTISVYPLQDTVSANGFQKIQAATTYDGWVNLLERPGTASENQLANASESYVAVYSRDMLTEGLAVEKQLVGEYYFVGSNKRVVVSVAALHKHWLQIQKSLRYFLDGFSLLSNSSSRTDADSIVYWQNSVSANKNTGYTRPVLSADTVYFSLDRTLIALDRETGCKKWVFQCPEVIRHPLVLGNDIVYGVFENPPRLLAVLANEGSVLYQKELPLPSSSEALLSIEKASFGIKVAYGVSQNREEAYWMDPYTGDEISSQPITVRFAPVETELVFSEAHSFPAPPLTLDFFFKKNKLFVRLIYKKINN